MLILAHKYSIFSRNNFSDIYSGIAFCYSMYQLNQLNSKSKTKRKQAVQKDKAIMSQKQSNCIFKTQKNWKKNTFLTFWNNFVNLLILKKKKKTQKICKKCRKFLPKVFFPRWCWWLKIRCTWSKLKKKKSNPLTTRKANQNCFDDMSKIQEKIEKN